jgi:hypothetical protein
MTAHKHAALMLQYAQDAAETDRPWERWEYKLHGEPWFECERNPTWPENVEYRRKPQVIKVGKWEFPKPISIGETPAIGAMLYLTEFGTAAEAFTVWNCEWDEAPHNMARLIGGLFHLTREAAQTHADVLNAICRGDID